MRDWLIFTVFLPSWKNYFAKPLNYYRSYAVIGHNLAFLIHSCFPDLVGCSPCFRSCSWKLKICTIYSACIVCSGLDKYKFSIFPAPTSPPPPSPPLHHVVQNWSWWCPHYRLCGCPFIFAKHNCMALVIKILRLLWSGCESGVT